MNPFDRIITLFEELTELVGVSLIVLAVVVALALVVAIALCPLVLVFILIMAITWGEKDGRKGINRKQIAWNKTYYGKIVKRN